jgi:hypothetical protein
MPARVTLSLQLQGLKARSNRNETQWFEPQPRQSGDWLSWQDIFFFDAD